MKVLLHISLRPGGCYKNSAKYWSPVLYSVHNCVIRPRVLLEVCTQYGVCSLGVQGRLAGNQTQSVNHWSPSALLLAALAEAWWGSQRQVLATPPPPPPLGTTDNLSIHPSIFQSLIQRTLAGQSRDHLQPWCISLDGSRIACTQV